VLAKAIYHVTKKKESLGEFTWALFLFYSKLPTVMKSCIFPVPL